MSIRACLTIFVKVCHTQIQTCGISPKLLKTGNFGANIAINDHTWSLLIILRPYRPF
jgi:hypothetical protein